MILKYEKGLYIVTFEDFARLYQAEKRMGMIQPNMDIRSWLKKKLYGYRFGALKRTNPKIIVAKGEMKQLLTRLLTQSKREERELSAIIPANKLLKDEFNLSLTVNKNCFCKISKILTH